MNPGQLITLFDLPTGQEAIVSSAPVPTLFEIGFIDGERVRVVARGHPGGDPVAVRVGNTMFALRRFEAERVLVSPLRGAVA